MDDLDKNMCLIKIRSCFQETYDLESCASVDQLVQIILDVQALYGGRWPTHEACQVKYHTLQHAMEVTLGAARMMSGWNRVQRDSAAELAATESEALSPECFLMGLAAALFHDVGYLKNRGDREGTGGKYAFSHVSRSKVIAQNYLREKGWPPLAIRLVPLIIEQTDFTKPVRLEGELSRFPGRVLTGVVGTMDLMAQMSDVHYMEKIPDLFSEFQEAYRFTEISSLKARGIRIFRSAQEMIDGTVGFFENFVVLRFRDLGSMESYLTAFFDGVCNPYVEVIVANLYRSMAESFVPHQPIRDVLINTGIIQQRVLEETLNRQGLQEIDKRMRVKLRRNQDHHSRSQSEKMIQWVDTHSSGQEDFSNALQFRHSVEEQLLSNDILDRLSNEDFITLIRIGLLLGNMRSLPGVYHQVLEMVNERVVCQSSSLWIAEAETQNLVLMTVSGTHADSVRRHATMPWDKGIIGWVYTRAQSVVVDNIYEDFQFYDESNSRPDYATHAIMAAPIVIEGKVLGVLECVNHHGKGVVVFEERDVVFLEIVAKYVAVSLDVVSWVMEK